ncbi:MAG: hypothetical protein ACLFT3_10460 [Cyclobacteriaceae bacterium]
MSPTRMDEMNVSKRPFFVMAAIQLPFSPILFKEDRSPGDRFPGDRSPGENDHQF